MCILHIYIPSRHSTVSTPVPTTMPRSQPRQRPAARQRPTASTRAWWPWLVALLAVVNAAACISGRYPNSGPLLLPVAGVGVLDGVGSEVMDLVEDGQDRKSVV